MDPSIATLDLDDRPALRDVRAWLAQALAGEAEDFVQDTVLLANELVSNAYDHAVAPRCIRIYREPGAVRIEVDDGSPQEPPQLGRSRLARTRGRGLRLVENLSVKWGVEFRDGRKTVWAKVASVGF